MTREQAQIIIALADSDLVIAKAAKLVPCHYNTIMYHTRKIIDERGLDIRNYYDISKLLPEARAVLAGEEKADGIE